MREELREVIRAPMPMAVVAERCELLALAAGSRAIERSPLLNKRVSRSTRDHVLSTAAKFIFAWLHAEQFGCGGLCVAKCSIGGGPEISAGRFASPTIVFLSAAPACSCSARAARAKPLSRRRLAPNCWHTTDYDAARQISRSS